MAIIRVTNVPSTALSDDVITSAKIADGTIAVSDLANDSVTEDKIASNAVTSAKIADSNITTAKIADSNITTAKVADGAITTGHMHSSVPLGTKNLLINGDMRIAQRGTSVSGINTGAGYYALDRWHLQYNGTIAGTWTMSQDNDVPTGQGFANSLKMQCTTAKATLDAGSLLQFNQRVEGQMIQHLCYGTSSAKTTTMSFWVKSNKTGTYAARMYNVDSNRQINSSFTINSTDTWEKKTITFSGDTTSAFDNDNNNSLILTIYFVAGTDFTSGTDMTTWSSYVAADSATTQTVNLADSTSNYINITGVQLEVGDTATPFEHRPYDMELQRCQRYFQKVGSFQAETSSNPTSTLVGAYTMYCPMRATPSVYGFTGSFHRPGIAFYTINSIDSVHDFEGNGYCAMTLATTPGGGVGGQKTGVISLQAEL